MRKALAAAVAVAVLVMAGCQDQQARDQNAKLQAELDLLKAQKASGGNDEFFKLLLAERQGGGNDDQAKRFNSLSEDITAGQSKLERLIKDNSADADKRMDEIDARLKRVSDLETTINTLKGMIETLETKVKSVDPNQVLEAQKELINKEADLRLEKQARAAADTEVAALKKKVSELEAEVSRVNGELTGMLNGDISKHAEYQKLQAEIRKLKSDLSDQKDIAENYKKKYEDLEAHLRKGSNPPAELPAPKEGTYAFTGEVVSVSKGGRPESPSTLLVSSFKAGSRIPPVGTELTVLDALQQPVCTVKVTRHFHVSDDEDLPVEEIGCTTIGEKLTRVVAKGDSVVWIEKATESSGGGTDSEKGKAGGD